MAPRKDPGGNEYKNPITKDSNASGDTGDESSKPDKNNPDDGEDNSDGE